LIFNNLERTKSVLDLPDKGANLEGYDHDVKLLLAKDENSYFIQE